jgi:hypothetical protein
MSALTSRRGFIIGASAAGSLAQSAPAAAVAPSDLSEATALFRDLNPSRRARMLANLRDCLAVQQLDEKKVRS